MIRFLKTVFQRPYTAKEIAATIEKHLIKPPLPPEWYDVAQSARDRQGRGLADGWRETLIIQEINAIASGLTWATQKQKLIEIILAHIATHNLYKCVHKLNNDDARHVVLADMYEAHYPLETKVMLLAQQFIVSLLSEVVLAEVGWKLYSFDKLQEDEIKFYKLLLDRFQSLRCGLWENAFDSEDAQSMIDFMREIIMPILREYSTLIELTSCQIASASFDAEDVKRRYQALESQISEVSTTLRGIAEGGER